MPRGTVEQVILSSIATAGLIAVAVLAPNALQVLRQLGFIKKGSTTPFYINTILGRLKDEGLIHFVKKGSSSKLELTDLGMSKLARYQLKVIRLKEDKWDQKWRVIIFDIKETRRSHRDEFRRQLIAQGFTRLQDSVWVYPYDCEELIGLVKTAYKLGPSILYIIAERIEHDEELRDTYGLPKV